ncbi:MAG TPA: tetratricopeptide repeat protein, partial [Armatimonadetes bacterium]|nr:tetratricopeptide repeat protein [Armatimonadota bacterium]
MNLRCKAMRVGSSMRIIALIEINSKRGLPLMMPKANHRVLKCRDKLKGYQDAPVAVMVIVCLLTVVILPLPSHGSGYTAELTPTTQFSSVTQLPTRLTIFNMHDDVARAVYSCCRPDQKEKIQQALKASMDFLTLYPNSDFAPYMLMYQARLYRLLKDFRHEVEVLKQVVERFPHSDVADDALWMLAQRYRQDWTVARALRERVLTKLVNNYVGSMYADDALYELVRVYTKERVERAALMALDSLLRKYPYSSFCDDAIWEVASKYRKLGNYPAAIRLYERLIRLFPFSQHADDSAFAIGQCYRHMQWRGHALRAFRAVITNFPGSPRARDALREINNLTRRSVHANLRGVLPSDTADDVFNQARHYELMGQYNAAIRMYRYFLANYRGNDRWAQALFNIGKCYQRMDILLDKISKAAGPEDIYRLLPDWRDAVGN